MKQIIKKGTTSKRIAVFISDSSSTTGAGLTGLAYNTSSLVAYYWREDTGNNGGTAITLATATRGTWTSGGFKEIDATNLPGWYEVGIPDAVLASGSYWAIMMLKGAANMAPCPIEIQLVTYDPNDGNLGLTALGSLTAPGATGGLIAIGTGTRDLNPNAGGVVITATGMQSFWDLLTSSQSTSGSIGKAIADNLTGNAYTRLGAPAGASIAADIATRLATSGYTAPPSAATNASAVRTELTTELGMIDVATSTRLATSGYTAPPSAATISTQVASDLQSAHGSGSWQTATGFSTLDAAGVRTAVGLGSANLDTQLSGINSKTTNIPALPAAVGSLMGITDGAITDAKFTLPTLGANTLATGPLGMIMQDWRANHYVEKFDSATGDLTRYASNGTTVLLVLPCTDVGGVQTRGAAS